MSESASPPESVPIDALLAGRDALARHAWEEAHELLSQADREGELSGADLEALAEATFFAAHAEHEIEVKERAFKAHLAAGDQLRAAYMALDIATDIVGSTALAETLGNEAWERLLSWHDDLLRGLIAGGGGEVVQSTGDGFFVAFDSAAQALACARAIQGALAEHRQSSENALSVRIGMHTAEANRRGSDYSGIGVHTAARVAALAEADQILATAETLSDANDPGVWDLSEVALRGLTTPVRLAAVG